LTLRIVRLGTARTPEEGVRIGAVRRPPRGVRKGDYAKLGYYDAWLPELAPSSKWVSWALSAPWTPARWARYARNYRGEMRAPTAERLIELLAALSQRADFSLGCYCEHEDRCHRSLLAELLRRRGAKLAMSSAKQRAAARRNIGKAAKAARKKRTISRLPKKTRTALGKQASKVAKQKRRKHR
jgi:uncharacterized protein YeaO (DUF488 family)